MNPRDPHLLLPPGAVQSPPPGLALRLFLWGPMGSGKTTLGRALSRHFGCPFFDLDEQVAIRAGMSLEALFEQVGEGGFRRLEGEALNAILTELPKEAVVALGDGSLVDPALRVRVRAVGLVASLEAPLAVLLSRLEGQSRPLAERLPELLSTRALAYRDVDFRLRTDVDELSELVAELAAKVSAFREMQDGVSVELGERSYALRFCSDSARRVASRAAALGASRALVVTDDNAREPHAVEILAALDAEGVLSRLVTILPGEGSKTPATMNDLYEAALDARLDRSSVIIAVGGGVVGDLAGYLAATYMRGLPWLVVPTTLLAQVDASIGGKTGVNLPQGKNLVGVIHQPADVFLDVHRLATLPLEEIRAGLAEVIKHAALASPSLLNRILIFAPQLLAREPLALNAVLREAVEIKVALVTQDEHERGVRQLLNLGHTLAHALEAAGAPLRHGEAVALGLALAARLSRSLALLPADDERRLLGALEAVGLSTDYKPWLGPEVLDRLAFDKKLRGEYVNYVLLDAVGRPRLCPMPTSTLARLIEEAGRGRGCC